MWLSGTIERCGMTGLPVVSKFRIRHDFYVVCVLLQNSHLALIDALMTAHVADIVTVERVVQAVRWVLHQNGVGQQSDI